MEIIKKGKIPNKKEIFTQLTCEHCNTIFRAEQRQFRRSLVMGDKSSYYMYIIVCPLCGTAVTVHEDDMGKDTPVDNQ